MYRIESGGEIRRYHHELSSTPSWLTSPAFSRGCSGSAPVVVPSGCNQIQGLSSRSFGRTAPRAGRIWRSSVSICTSALALDVMGFRQRIDARLARKLQSDDEACDN